MVEKIADMNVMRGVDNSKMAIQAVFIQCNCVFRILLKACDIIVRVTWRNVGCKLGLWDFGVEMSTNFWDLS
jgi:hypothetical protein